MILSFLQSNILSIPLQVPHVTTNKFFIITNYVVMIFFFLSVNAIEFLYLNSNANKVAWGSDTSTRCLICQISKCWIHEFGIIINTSKKYLKKKAIIITTYKSLKRQVIIISKVKVRIQKRVKIVYNYKTLFRLSNRTRRTHEESDTITWPTRV